MKLGLRNFSINKRISARTKGRITRSIKRRTVPFYGKYGMIKNPKRALYNKAYHRTTVDVKTLSSAVVPSLIIVPFALIWYCFVKWPCQLMYYMFKWIFLLYFYIFKYGFICGKIAYKWAVPLITNYIKSKRVKTT